MNLSYSERQIFLLNTMLITSFQTDKQKVSVKVQIKHIVNRTMRNRTLIPETTASYLLFIKLTFLYGFLWYITK